MKEPRSLKFLDKFKKIYSRFGVDYEVMRLILKVKLTMDGRKVATIFNNSKNDKKDKNQFYRSLMMYGFMGFFLMFFMLLDTNIMWQMSIYFSTFMFIILTIFISDFSTVLLDVKDKILIGTKGVDSRTLNAAKLTHILIYMISLTLALGGFSILASFKYGIGFFLIFFIELIIIDLFMIIITTLLYLLILKFFDGEKLKDVINIVQIILTIFMTIVYQLPGRFGNFLDIKGSFNIKPWHYAFPPIWFAAPLKSIKDREINLTLLILIVLSIIIPLISMIVYYKLIPSFERYLEKLNNNSYANEGEKEPRYIKIGEILCKDKQERSFFNFTCGLIKHEREFKLKVYPALAMAFIFPFLFMFIGIEHNEFKSFANWKNFMENSTRFLNIYFCGVMLSTVIPTMKFSERYKGAWIYRVSPLKDTSPIFKGCFKGILYKLVLPIILLESVVYVFIFNIKVLPHLIIAFLAIVFLCMITFIVMDKALPFSKEFKASESGGDIGSFFLCMFLGVFLAGGHFAAIKLSSYGIYLYAVVLISLILFTWKTAFKVSWKSIMK